MGKGGARVGAGRKRKPTSLLLLQGKTNKAKKRIEGGEPPILKVEDVQLLDCMDELAAKIYIQNVEKLTKIQVLSETDVMMLQIYSINCANWMKLQEQIKAERAKGDGASNRTIEGWLKLSQKLAVDILKESVEFGLTPSARAKMKIIKEKPEIDELEEFLG